MFNIDKITRTNIRQMKPYSSARSEFEGQADIWLDANENPNETSLNRYPDPLQINLKKKVADLRSVNINQIFIGNGSDEAIDLLFRAFCEPGKDKAIIFPPTYGMYQVSAAINNVEIIEIPLVSDFGLPSINEIKEKLASSGLLFICSPNNPTGNHTDRASIKQIASLYEGLVIVDEAYIDFSATESTVSLLQEVPNLVVLQTMSKAYGLAGARVGMAFASPEIIAVLNKIKPPYNINSLSIKAAVDVMSNQESINNQITEIVNERKNLANNLNKLSNVIRTYPSETNFLLVEFKDSQVVFQQLIRDGIVLRNRASQVKDCLRITVGTKKENQQLLKTLETIQS
jgi:histidinol-phosphate aminotransferase